MGFTEIFVSYVAPSVGALVANVMFSSPLVAVLAVRRRGELGDLNPLPFPVIFSNCVCWLVYSFFTFDWFLYFGNLPGALLGLFFVLSTVLYAPPKMRKMMEATMIILGAEIILTAGALVFSRSSETTRNFVWGLNCNIILLVYYAAPCSAVVSVFRSRSSAELYWPMCLANFTNGVMWFSYGLWGLNDYWLWVPNGLGAVLAAFQLVLCVAFPRDRRRGVPAVSSSDNLAPLAPAAHPDTGVCLPGRVTSRLLVGL